MERCLSLDSAELRASAGLTVSLLAENLVYSSALYLHELFNLCLNIISKYEYSSLSLNIFVALSLQWLHLPSYLTSSALKVAAKIIDIYEQETKDDHRVFIPNLKSNKTFESFLYTDGHLCTVVKLHQIWERVRDNPEPDKLTDWFDDLDRVHDNLKLEMLPFLFGVILENRKEANLEAIKIKAISMASALVNCKKEVSVQLLPILLYKIAHDQSPTVKETCLKALPTMAKTKENVPTIVAILNKLRSNKGVPTSFLIHLYTSLAETQVRCFPYLQELLVDPGTGRADCLKWETDIARALAVRRICQIRASSHGLELVSVISSILNKCTDRPGAVASSIAIEALAHLWREGAVAPPSTWRALEPKLGKDHRVVVQITLCKLLSEVPSLRVSTPEYDKLISSTARKLWSYIAESNEPTVVEAACDALAGYRVDDYTLKDVPEVYRRSVKLPASYCKTPADAARKPEDVLDYIPCEIWPEVFKLTNQAALQGVERLVARLIEREIRGYRSGVYQRDARQEPDNLSYLPPHSVVRGLFDTFRKQAMSPSYDFSDQVLLSIINVLTAEFPRPLPPLDIAFLHELFHRGSQWRAPCVTLAARQAQISSSARRFLDNWLVGIEPRTTQESDILLLFELLPILCRGIPPNSLRDPLQKCLYEAFSEISNIKNKDISNLSYIEKNISKNSKGCGKNSESDGKNSTGDGKNSESDGKNSTGDGKNSTSDGKNSEEKEYLFLKQLNLIRECLECEKIHDANRTLLSQIVENYFSTIDDDNVAWPTYVQTCTSLSSVYLERMTSPTGWWEVTGALIRKASSARCAVAGAANSDCAAPLVWLNEIIDAQATQITEQEYSLRCIMIPLKTAPPDDQATRDWLLKLMARTQVAFTETEEESAKLYLCDVFMLAVCTLSGHWALAGGGAGAELAGGNTGTTSTASRRARQDALPASAVALMARDEWGHCVAPLLEWLSHVGGGGGGATRALRSGGDGDVAALACQRALLALRHTPSFTQHKLWKRLHSHFGKAVSSIDD